MRVMAADVEVLVISGSMGSGKTTVLAEASDLLTLAHTVHAALDLDHLSLGYFPGTASDELMIRNLTGIWSNYAALGVRRLILCEALDSVAKRERLQKAIPRSRITVCRLHAKVETMQNRIRIREPGMLQEQFVRRVAELEASLDAARIEDFRIDNDDHAITVVARELLVRAAWL
jgi:gluconate kinase